MALRAVLVLLAACWLLADGSNLRPMSHDVFRTAQVAPTTPTAVVAAVGQPSVLGQGSRPVDLLGRWAWGDKSAGQPGDGTTNSHATPVQVSGLSAIMAVGGPHVGNSTAGASQRAGYRTIKNLLTRREYNK